MKVRTSFRAGPFALNFAFAVFCLIGALWGAYDYWIAYPALERANTELEEAKSTIRALESTVAGRADSIQSAPSVVTTPLLTDEDRAKYEAAKETIRRITTEHGGEPRQLAAYDRPLQLWLWVIGCGVLGLPFFIWPLIRMTRRHWTLDESDTLTTPDAVVPIDQITDIDMSRWCAPTGSKRSTWKAWLVTKDGRRLELDDHDYKDMHLIIGFYAHRFYPDQWTQNAKRVEAVTESEATATEPEAMSEPGADR